MGKKKNKRQGSKKDNKRELKKDNKKESREKLNNEQEDNFNFVNNQNEILSTTDIIVDSFAISVGKKQLFIDSSLSICKGKKYGLIGINGAGKTTLMTHIAKRKIRYFFRCSCKFSYTMQSLVCYFSWETPMFSIHFLCI